MVDPSIDRGEPSFDLVSIGGTSISAHSAAPMIIGGHMETSSIRVLLEVVERVLSSRSTRAGATRFAGVIR